MSEKSALRLIPGKDALLEYQPVVYKAKTYVEYQGLVYKALVDTTATFVPTEWELISDLREVRVRTIGDRNALTGSTPTTGTTGIHIPILDNTNVLVLHAQADPQVAADKFARYNYNKTTNSFLLLQVSTGSTGSNVSDYNVLSNKPPIISGITATAGVGLTGGGVFSGGVPPNRATFSFAHADTSSQANINSTGFTYVQKLKFDTFGHVTGATSSTWVHPDTSSQPSINGSGFTYIQSVQLDTDGHVLSLVPATWVHPDTSSQGSVINAGSNVIQSIFLDTDGHITGITSALISGGGGGTSFNVAGNSGGAFTMPTGGTLQITGGTNIQTISSLHGTNLGVRINLNPAGSVNQLQINSGSGLSAFANLTFTGGTTLLTNKLALTTTPISGATANQFITRNPANGNIQSLNFTTIERAMVGQPQNSIQFNGLGYFSGDSQFIYDPIFKAITLGSRGGGAVGFYSTVFGLAAIATGTSSHAEGQQTKAYGTYSHAEGLLTIASAIYSHAEGGQTQASAQGSHAEGGLTIASGQYSHAEGFTTVASGQSSHAGGFTGVNRPVVAGGLASFNHSLNTGSQTVGFGALANQSAILGGQDHNIAVGNTNAVILGGTTIRLTGSSYINYVAVPNLAIFTVPSAGGSDDVLTWNSVSKKVGKVTQASLSGGGGGGTPAGANGYIQLRNATGSFDATANLIFLTGSSTLQTSNLNLGSLPSSGNTGNAILTRNSGTGAIERFAFSNLPGAPVNSIQYNSGVGFGGKSIWIFDPSTSGVTLGTRTGTTGQYSMTIGTSNGASGLYSMSVGSQNRASGFASYAGGALSVASGQYSHAHGLQALAIAPYAHAEGQTVIASGDTSHAEGRGTMAGGLYSHAEGAFNVANGNYSHAEGFTTIALGQYSHTQGIYTKATGQASFAAGNGFNTTIPILASGFGSINISSNSNAQVAGQGALGTYAAIFGGTDGHIVSTDTASVLIGGQSNRIIGVGQRGGILAGSSNVITGNTNQVAIVAGNSNVIGGNFTSSAIIAGGQNKMRGNSSNNSTIVGGLGNLISTSGSTINSTILGSNQSSILGGGSTILMLGGNFNTISGNSTVNTIQFSSIINGSGNQILNRVVASTIVGGGNNTLSGSTSSSPAYLSIVGGSLNKMIGNTTYSSIVGGNNNSITGTSTYDAIIVGQQNKINTGVNNSVIIGGQNITLTGNSQSNNAVVPNLMIWNTPGIASATDGILSWNSITRKVSLAPSYSNQNVAYVAKNGNNATAIVGNISRPYLTITAALTAVAASSPALAASNKGLVIVTQGQYSENITLRNYVDIQLENSEFLGASDGAVSAITRIYGMGKFKSLTCQAASNIDVDVDEINTVGNVIFIQTTSVVPEIKIKAKKIVGSIQANNGNVIINTDLYMDGSINPFGTTSVLLNLFINATYMTTSGFNPPLAFLSSGTNHANVTIKSSRIECLNTGSISAINISSNYEGRLIIDANEIVSSGTSPTVSISAALATNNITIGGKIINKNGGNIAAANFGQGGSAVIKVMSGSQFIPSGSASSITGAGNLVALGQIFGKNALSGAPTIQVGTFTANSTYII